MQTIWVVDDDASIRWVLERALSREKYQVCCFESADTAIEAHRSGTPAADVVMSDVRMPGRDGFAFATWLQRHLPDVPIIIMTAYTDLDSAVGAFSRGAFEYLPKPFDIHEALALVARALKAGQSHGVVLENNAGSSMAMIGEAPAMQDVYRAIARMARSSTTVLIHGESGTGKELIARALHRHSPREKAPFIALNMAAIPRDLMESELFGHERGAFTGAQNARDGRFTQADGGTLFLDEIGDMPPELQTRLLRVLADGEFYPVGAHRPRRVDVRIIAATHQNLSLCVENGSFREDLYHRLNVIKLNVPPLRARTEDIEGLMCHFLGTSARELGVEEKQLSRRTVVLMNQLPWPGNVRQLENTARWLTIMVSAQVVEPEDLPDELTNTVLSDRGEHESWEQALRVWAEQALSQGTENLLKDALPKFEHVLLQAALKRTGERRIEAAGLLGWGRNTITRKIRELGP